MEDGRQLPCTGERKSPEQRRRGALLCSQLTPPLTERSSSSSSGCRLTSCQSQTSSSNSHSLLVEVFAETPPPPPQIKESLPAEKHHHILLILLILQLIINFCSLLSKLRGPSAPDYAYLTFLLSFVFCASRSLRYLSCRLQDLDTKVREPLPVGLRNRGMVCLRISDSSFLNLMVMKAGSSCGSHPGVGYRQNILVPVYVR